MLAMYVMVIGVNFGLFTRITKIPTFWPSVILIIIITIFANSVVLTSRSVLLTLLLFLVIIIYEYFNHFNGLPDVMTKPFGIFSIVFPYMLVAIIIENLLVLKRYSNTLLSQMGRFSLLIYILALFISVINEISHSGIMRSNFQDHQNLPVWLWTVSFGTLYSMPFILMAIVMLYKGKMSYLYVIIIVFSVIKSGFTIALFVSGIGLLIATLYRLGIKVFYFNLLIVMVVAVIGLYNTNAIVGFLPELPNTIYSEKSSDIIKIVNNINFIDMLASTRQGTYDASVNTIIKYPFFGSGDFQDSGQHSYILDRLSFIGFIGTFFYIVVLLTLYRKALLLIPKNAQKAYSYIFLTICILLIFNPIEWPDFWVSIFVILPSIIVYLSNEEDSKYSLVENENNIYPRNEPIL